MGTEVCGPSFTVRRSGFGVRSSKRLLQQLVVEALEGQRVSGS